MLLFSPGSIYCNAVLAGMSNSILTKIQFVQNSAARILSRSRSRDHITPVLEALHWLPIKFRIDFKILMLTYKALHGLAPTYLSDLLSFYTPTRNLRSADFSLLCVPPARLRSYGRQGLLLLCPQIMELNSTRDQGLGFFECF